QQLEDFVEHPGRHGACLVLRRAVSPGEQRLRQLHVPVAVDVPNKAIGRRRRLVEAVLLDRLGDLAHETAKAVREVTEAIEQYRFNEAAAAAYRFVWNVYCDWYVELSKPLLTGADGAAKNETRAMAAWVLDEILKLL